MLQLVPESKIMEVAYFIRYWGKLMEIVSWPGIYVLTVFIGCNLSVLGKIELSSSTFIFLLFLFLATICFFVLYTCRSSVYYQILIILIALLPFVNNYTIHCYVQLSSSIFIFLLFLFLVQFS